MSILLFICEDETPINSERFIELGGIQCFMQSFEVSTIDDICDSINLSKNADC